jgi:hypothetical protein
MAAVDIFPVLVIQLYKQLNMFIDKINAVFEFLTNLFDLKASFSLIVFVRYL